MPFSDYQNEQDIFPVLEYNDSKYEATATTSIIGFVTKSPIQIEALEMIVAGATGGFGTLKAELFEGLAASGGLMMSAAPTAASTLVSGTSLDTSIASTSLYATYAPAGAALSVKITSSAAGDVVTGVHVGVYGRRYHNA